MGMLAFAACGKEPAQTDNKDVVRDGSNAIVTSEEWMLETAESLYADLQTLVGDKLYVKMMVSSTSLQEKVENLKGIQLKKSEPIYVMPINMDYVKDALDDQRMDYDDFTAPAKKRLEMQMKGSVTSMINAQFGADYLAISSMLGVSDTYKVSEGVKDQILFLSTDRDDVYVAVSFLENKDFSMQTVNCGFVFCNSDIKKMIGKVYPGTKVTEIEWK